MEEDSWTQTNKHIDEQHIADVNNTPVIVGGDACPLNRDMQLVHRKGGRSQQIDTEQTNLYI